MEPVIELQNLTKRFWTGGSPVLALDRVSLTVQPGEIFGIIGLSGAGKSTLVRCMNRLEQPESGRVLFRGQDLTALHGRALRQVQRSMAMIFQGFHLLEQRTALDNVCFPLELSGVPRARARIRARALLETVGLPDKAEAYPCQLSGGQKQRVAIARALAGEPRVLLCDEATSALDPATSRSILQLLRQINRETGVTIVIITHQMAVIEAVCTRVAILDHGRVAECGPVTEIFSHPQSRAGQRLVFPDGVPDRLPEGVRTARLAFDGAAADQPVIASLALELGLRVTILAADTRSVDGRSFGTMLIGLPRDEADARRALNYLQSQPGLTAQEVEA